MPALDCGVATEACTRHRGHDSACSERRDVGQWDPGTQRKAAADRSRSRNGQAVYQVQAAKTLQTGKRRMALGSQHYTARVKQHSQTHPCLG